MSSSSNNPFSVYGTPSNTGSPLGMGSLQNLNRSGSSLAQLSRAAVASQSSSSVVNSSLMGFNSTVGGGKMLFYFYYFCVKQLWLTCVDFNVNNFSSQVEWLQPPHLPVFHPVLVSFCEWKERVNCRQKNEKNNTDFVGNEIATEFLICLLSWQCQLSLIYSVDNRDLISLKIGIIFLPAEKQWHLVNCWI